MTKLIASYKKSKIEFRINNGLVVEGSFIDATGEGQTYKRKEKDKIKWLLSLSFQDDFEAFKEILHNIKKDEGFISYGKMLMEIAKQDWEQALQKHQKKKAQIIKELEEETERLLVEVNKYTWSE